MAGRGARRSGGVVTRWLGVVSAAALASPGCVDAGPPELYSVGVYGDDGWNRDLDFRSGRPQRLSPSFRYLMFSYDQLMDLESFGDHLEIVDGSGEAVPVRLAQRWGESVELRFRLGAPSEGNVLSLGQGAENWRGVAVGEAVTIELGVRSRAP